jgi:diguanylate cyclase (GGDEF)-like protein
MSQWWSSPYVLAVLAVGLVLLIREVIRFRTIRLLQRQRELETAVQLRTKELEFERSALIAVREELTLRAMRDGLTGLFNRSAIFEIIERELDRAKRGEKPVAIIIADLDHFKSINDTYGHLVGDLVLVESARRLTQDLRVYDCTGRYGGEELLIVLSNCDHQGAFNRAEDLRTRLRSEPIRCRNFEISVTASFGVAISTPGLDANTFVNQADEALYEAKRTGRDRVVAAWEQPSAREKMDSVG